MRRFFCALLVCCVLVLSATVTFGATLGEKNALSQAKMYLSMTAFSYSGLVQQLEFEGYTHAEAVYGVDNCGADWNEQAAKKAQEYLEMTSFSRKGLVDQLKFEGFTTEQANYGVNRLDIDNEGPLKSEGAFVYRILGHVSSPEIFLDGGIDKFRILSIIYDNMTKEEMGYERGKIYSVGGSCSRRACTRI